MARRKDQSEQPEPQVHPVPARVLVVTSSRTQRELMSAQLSGRVATLSHADSPHAARIAASKSQFDVAIVAAELAGGGLALTRELTEAHPELCVVVLADKPSLDDAVGAMRSGATDMVPCGTRGPELLTRIAEAFRRSRGTRAREDRIERLRKLCRRLNETREQVTNQVGGLCNDLVGAYSELSDKLTLVTVASEFNSLVRQELDIESLLRTVLEYVLTKTGPTNAAIFLPSTSGDFTLGAYVNYDGPKDSGEVLLDHLAAALAPRFENEPGITLLTGRDELESRLGKCADWLSDSTLAAFACHNDDECLAVVTLFRDKRVPFGKDLLPVLETLSVLFAKQLTRVVKVHHRHLPPTQWGTDCGPGEDDDGAPDIDLAA